MAYVYRLIIAMCLFLASSFSFASISSATYWWPGGNGVQPGYSSPDEALSAWASVHSGPTSPVSPGSCSVSGNSATCTYTSCFIYSPVSSDCSPGTVVFSSISSCPANSTLSGGVCVCASGYVESNGQCIKPNDCKSGDTNQFTFPYGITYDLSDPGNYAIKYPLVESYCDGSCNWSMVPGGNGISSIDTTIAPNSSGLHDVSITGNYTNTGTSCSTKTNVPGSGANNGNNSNNPNNNTNDPNNSNNNNNNSNNNNNNNSNNNNCKTDANGITTCSNNNNNSCATQADGSIVCVTNNPNNNNSNCTVGADGTVSCNNNNNCKLNPDGTNTCNNDNDCKINADNTITCNNNNNNNCKVDSSGVITCNNNNNCKINSDGSSTCSNNNNCKTNSDGTLTCGKPNDNSNTFGGSCGGFSCDGDAIQCSIALEQHNRDCALFDTPSDESKLYYSEKGKDGDQTKDLPGNETIDMSSRIDTSDAFGGGGGCISDLTITVFKTSVTLPISKLCPYFTMLGTILVAVSFLSAAKIIGKG